MGLDDVIPQAVFAGLVGVSEGRVSQLASEGLLPDGGSMRQWLLAYCGRLREQAAGRYTEGPLDLSQERAALAREQRLGLEIKNLALRGQYASISLLAQVLASASQAVAERFDHLPGMLKKTCPQLSDAERDQVVAIIASARNEWVRSTAELVAATFEDQEDEPELLGLADEPRAD